MTQDNKYILPQAEPHIVKSHDIPKLYQCVGELQYAVNHVIMSQAKNNWLSEYASCKRNCGRQNV